MNRTIVVMAGLAGFVSGCAGIREIVRDDLHLVHQAGLSGEGSIDSVRH